jgi:uncharacterized membrane protein SpoIIM required for sporulation
MLEALVDTAEKRGLAALSAEDLERLPTLYRAAVSSLSVARAISLDRNVLDYLDALCQRAFLCVYAARRPVGGVVRDFFARRFPEEVRRFAGALAVAAATLLLGILTAYAMTSADPERFYDFVNDAYAQGRSPASSTEELRDVLYDEGGGPLGTFASFLFTHNARVGMLCFALGFAAGVPVFVLLFTNGLLLGAFGALYASRGLGLDFWGWVLPHGVTELLAVLLCATGGLALGRALVFPGRATRLESLAATGRRAGTLVLGAVCLLFVAGLLEGFFRQLVTSLVARYAVALGTAAFWIVYFLGAGRERGP